MMKRILVAIMATFLVLTAKVIADDDIINFPDSNFKWILVNMTEYSQPQIDLNYDGEIQRSEAVEFKGLLWLGPNKITDLTGIKEFINVTKILMNYCNGIKEIDLSGMVNLREVNFDNSPNLDKFDVSGCANLKKMDCSYNILIDLNIYGCVNLDLIRCYNTSLTKFQVLDFPKLRYLFIPNNLILNLIITNLPELWRVQLNGNQLTSLDLSNFTKLDQLWVSDNKLASLNIRNNNNTLITSFKANNNPDLKCITADDSEWSKENWKEIDEWTEFSENCSTSVNENQQNTFKVYPNPANNSVTIEREMIEQADLRILDITGRIILSYTIPYGTNHIQLDISRLSIGNYLIEINNETKSLIIK